jgi:hypothetical protein
MDEIVLGRLGEDGVRGDCCGRRSTLFEETGMNIRNVAILAFAIAFSAFGQEPEDQPTPGL